MIKLKSGKKIFDFISFRKHFNLEEMLPLAIQISQDRDLFISDEGLKYTQHILNYVIKSNLQHIPLYVNDGKVTLIAGNNTYEVVYTVPEISGTEILLERESVIGLLISELGGVAYNEGNIAKNTPQTVSANPFATSSVSIKENCIIRVPAYNSSTQDGDIIELVSIHNTTTTGYTRIILECNDSDDIEYKLEAQNFMFVLRINGGYLNKLPQLSLSKNHANYLSYNGDSVKACNLSFDKSNDKYPHDDIVHRFKAKELTQICADERGGFIALMDGKIITYSNDVQPDDVYDLMMDIPADEEIVMIQLVAHQIYALTNRMKVYSNYPVYVENNGNIVWLDKNSDGTIQLISKENFKHPTCVDKQTIGTTTISYNNGKIS